MRVFVILVNDRCRTGPKLSFDMSDRRQYGLNLSHFDRHLNQL